MPNHESHHPGHDIGLHGHGPGHHSHGHDGPGHHGPGHGPGRHGHGPTGMPGPLQFFMVNALITQMFVRFFLVAAAIALLKIARSLTLGAKVKALHETRDDLTAEQRAELVDDIWRLARRKRLSNCPVMPPNCCAPKTLVADATKSEVAAAE